MKARLLLLLVLLGCAVVPVSPAFAPPDWEALATESTVIVVTSDPDGSERVTTVWLAVVAGKGFIRTGSTRWYANLQRDPDLVFRAAGQEFPLRAEFVADGELADEIDAEFRRKYGFSDRVVSFFRGDGANWMQLVGR